MTKRQAQKEAPTFYDLYLQWLGTRAAIGAIPADVDNEDQLWTEALDRVKAAEWRLLQMPAKDFADIRTRAAIVQELFTSADRDGRPTDNRHQLMLASLVLEISTYSEAD